MKVIILENSYGVRPGTYDRMTFAALLRRHARDAAAILFLADMLE